MLSTYLGRGICWRRSTRCGGCSLRAARSCPRSCGPFLIKHLRESYDMKKIATFVPIAVSILILTVVSIPLIMGAVENIYTYLAGSAGLIASWIGLYSSVIRPVLRKPEVSLEPITSTVVFEPEEGLKTYLRLKVTNIGLTAAKNCVGRILELRDEDN